MKKCVFDGVATALVTPFDGDKIDFNALKKLVKRQVDGGIDALVTAGTTGEGALLSEREKCELIVFCKDVLAKNGLFKGQKPSKIGSKRKNAESVGVPVIAGISENSTERAIIQAKLYEQEGADALLLPVPSYLKPEKEGIIRHFYAVANGVDVPIIAYYAPSRNAVTLSAATIRKILRHPNIVGIKDCDDSPNHLVETTSGGTGAVYAGNDGSFLPALSVGASGLVSVASNLFPKTVKKIYSSFEVGDWTLALNYQRKISEFCSFLFRKINPMGVKAVLNKFGLVKNSLRLPLTEWKILPSSRFFALAEKLMAEEEFLW